jgi:hypothetical protein
MYLRDFAQATRRAADTGTMPQNAGPAPLPAPDSPRYDPLADAFVTRALKRGTDTIGTAGVVVVILAALFGYIAVTQALFGKTGFWVATEICIVALLPWASKNLRKARMGNATQATISKYRNSFLGLCGFAILGAIRLATHAY